MKVILLEDVKSLGKKGQTVEVSDGYARNFILPKKLGVEANAVNENNLKLQKAHEEKVAKEKLEEAKALAAKIAEMSVEVSIKSGKDGRRDFRIGEILPSILKIGQILVEKF